MIQPSIDPKDLESWAGILLDHSMGGVTPDDRVMIKGEPITWPLVEVLERHVIEAGGMPDVCLVPPNNERGRVFSSAMVRYGNDAQLRRAPDWHRERYTSMTKYIEVLGAEDPSLYAGLTAPQLQALAATDRPFVDLRVARRWVLTLFPTPGHAAMEGIPYVEYTRFLVQASTTDPRPLRAAEERLAPLFETGRKVTIVTWYPREKRELTLELDIAPSRPMTSYGLRNFPDGEIFTSPDARFSQGELYLDLPIHQAGGDIQGIYLQLSGGKITRYDAEIGRDRLAAIVETDAGSHRLGEVALGMNPGLERALKHPLLVEKVGGTLHVAIGASYETCFVADPASSEGRARLTEFEASGALNRSAQHVDLVVDFRPGGCGRRVLFDGREVVVRDRVWVLAR